MRRDCEWVGMQANLTHSFMAKKEKLVEMMTEEEEDFAEMLDDLISLLTTTPRRPSGPRWS